MLEPFQRIIMYEKRRELIIEALPLAVQLINSIQSPNLKIDREKNLVSIQNTFSEEKRKRYI